MSTCVLDANALLAYLRREPGHETVTSLFAAAAREETDLLMSCINVGEALYMTWRKGSPAKFDKLLALLPQFPIQVLDVDLALTTEAARFKATRKMSYADCIAAALAKQHEAEVVTGDPEFAAVEDDIAVRWLRAAD